MARAGEHAKVSRESGTGRRRAGSERGVEGMAWDVRQSAEFEAWLVGFRDKVARAIIVRRIARVAGGNLGDVRPVGGGVSELRIDHGPGFRAYFVRRGEKLIVLLCGGDKGSQARDIARVKALAQEV
jgi:putative addiction module killer protein